MSGMWKQKETFDGTYTGDDLLEAHEILDVKEETERRWQEYAAMQRKLNA